MNVLVCCEYSGLVRDAFAARGHNAWSCDILPTEIPGNHYQIPLEILLQWPVKWDMLIGFPPCTYVCFAGIRWNVGNPERQAKTADAVNFFRMIWEFPTDKIAIENPVGVIPRHTGINWTQMIHPWQFGHGEQKKTCLWLKNLPPLVPTNVVEGREQKVFKMGPRVDRAKLRSKTYEGIARAMAEQWG